MAVLPPTNEKSLSSSPMPEKKKIEKASSDPMAIAIEKARPIIAKVSFGSVMGFCSGYAVKQAGKVAALVLGTGFIALQTCVSYGYIEVDWGKVKDDAIKKVDTVSAQKFTRSPNSILSGSSLLCLAEGDAMHKL